MKKIIKKDLDLNITQITIADERWYLKQTEKDLEPIYVPSVTWICSFYPKGIPFYKWLANKGWNEAEAIKSAAGDKGSKVHLAIVDLIDGKEVKMDSMYINPTTEFAEELTLEEYEAIMSFVEWWNINKPTVITKEAIVFNEEYSYAGTVDLICEIEGEKWLIDFKTGQNIWPEHLLQVSAYKHCLEHYKDLQLGILQLGYYRNKKNFKFTEVEDKFEVFLSTRNIWKDQTEKIEPKKRDYPVSLKLEILKEGGETDE